MSDKKIVKNLAMTRVGAVLSVGGLIFIILNHFIRWYTIDPTIMFVIIIAVILLLLNPSCYQRKLMEQARTKRATFNSKPLVVTA